MAADFQKEPNEKKEQRRIETITQRVRRHLTDIRSEITEEDIRDARIDLEVANRWFTPEDTAVGETFQKQNPA